MIALRSMFRLLLLVSVVLNLGDAPYFDEFTDAMGGACTSARVDENHVGTPNDGRVPDQAAMALYEHLMMTNIGLVPLQQIILAVQPSHETPATVLTLFIPASPVGRIERPPRLT